MDGQLRKRLRLLWWVALAVALAVINVVRVPQSVLLLLVICSGVVFIVVVSFGSYRRSRHRR